MSTLLRKLRMTAVGDRVYRAARNTVQGRGWGGFHADKIYQGLIVELLGAFPFTSFVETGTSLGYSTEMVATRFPNVPIYTSEVVESTYKRSKHHLGRYPNITCLLQSSDEAVGQLIREKKLGELPLFYLDAHWQRYWPLRKELEHIGASGIRCVIVIDDFQVPGLDRFGFDIDGGGEIVEGEECNLAYIAGALRSGGQRYEAFYPMYSAQDAFGPSGKGFLRGHITLFQNMPDGYQAFGQRPFVRKNYAPVGAVPTS